MLLNLLTPRFFVPAHGEYRHQYLHAELAREVGIPDERIFILDNGDVLEITAESAAITGKVPAGMMFVDGLQIGGAEHVVLRERQQLSGDGILIAVVTVSVQTGATVAPPELVARGFLYDEETEADLLAEARDELTRRLEELTHEHATGQRQLREDVHDTLAQFIYRRTRREPLIMPVVVEL